MRLTCEECDCGRPARAFQVPDNYEHGDDPDDVVEFETLCDEHARDAGYCLGCMAFWGGVESFDFNNPSGLCDICRESI